jgi:peptide/nickel transport system ATP-binding protein
MQQGRIVEEGDTRSVFRDPRHPYTRLLLESIPRLRRSGVAQVEEKQRRSN